MTVCDYVCHRASRPDVAVIREQRLDVIRWRHLHHVSVDASRGSQVVVYFRLFKGFSRRRQLPLSSTMSISSSHSSLPRSYAWILVKKLFILYL